MSSSSKVGGLKLPQPPPAPPSLCKPFQQEEIPCKSEDINLLTVSS